MTRRWKLYDGEVKEKGDVPAPPGFSSSNEVRVIQCGGMRCIVGLTHVQHHAAREQVARTKEDNAPLMMKVRIGCALLLLALVLLPAMPLAL